MTTIYLIRHAEAEGNLYRIVQGQDNSSLTDRGWRQVRALERRFQNIHIDAVYSSDLYRTCATASAVCKPKGLPLHRVPALREICVGAWERMTWGDIYRRWPEQMGYFSRRPDLWSVEGAESAQQVLDRALEALRAIVAENEGRTVAVFSHGYLIRLTLSYLQGYSLEETGKTPTGDNTCVALLEAEDDTLRVVYRDDNSHLKTPEYLVMEKTREPAATLEPGLRFEPIRLPEQAEFLRSLIAGEHPGDFDGEKLLADAACRDTLVGYLEEEPVGAVQLGPEPGRISLACIRRDCRKRGFGVQLIGQAVQRTRAQGVEKLSVVLSEDSSARTFFRDYGFVTVGTAGDGRVLFEKDISFDPEFLGES